MKTPSQNETRKRGNVAVLTVVTLPVLLGFAALTVDVGMLYNVRADLQRTADAAALAGAWVYFEDTEPTQNHSELWFDVVHRTQETGLENATLGKTGTVLNVPDILVGRHDFDDPMGPMHFDGRWNAVHVTARRTHDGPNGAVPLLFAAIFGKYQSDVTATARAAMSDHFAGLQFKEDCYPSLIPFTIHRVMYEDQVVNGPDDFSYDDGVQEWGDGIPEVHLFPDKVWEEEPEGDGNGAFGLTNVDGTGNTAQLSEQITNGITPEELENEFGASALIYFDEDGNPQTYQVNGSTGIKVAVQGALEARVGDVIGFFLHDSVTSQGSNTYFTNIGLRFGRVMEVHLTGGNKRLVIQPVTHTGECVIVDESVPSTGGQLGRVFLVR